MLNKRLAYICGQYITHWMCLLFLQAQNIDNISYSKNKCVQIVTADILLLVAFFILCIIYMKLACLYEMSSVVKTQDRKSTYSLFDACSRH